MVGAQQPLIGGKAGAQSNGLATPGWGAQRKAGPSGAGTRAAFLGDVGWG